MPSRATKMRRPVSTSIVPKIERFAFFPLIGTFAGFPRKNHPALNGGKSSTSVSSSNSLAQLFGKFLTFFRINRNLLFTLGDFEKGRSWRGLFHTYFSRRNCWRT